MMSMGLFDDPEIRRQILHDVRRAINPLVSLGTMPHYQSELCKAINALLYAYDDIGSTYFATHRREILTGQDLVTINQLTYLIDENADNFNIRDINSRSILYQYNDFMEHDLELIVDQTVALLNSPE